MNYLKILPKFLNKAPKPQEEKRGFTAYYDDFDITMTFKNKNKTIKKDVANKITSFIISLQEHTNSFDIITKT